MPMWVCLSGEDFIVSTHMKLLAQLDHAFGLRIPALRRVGVGVEVALHADLGAAFGESQQATQRTRVYRDMETCEAAAVDKRRAPFTLDVRAAIEMIVGVRMRVSTEPQVNRTGMGVEVFLEGHRLGFVIDVVEIRRAFGTAAIFLVAEGTMGTRTIGDDCRQFDSMKLSETQFVGVPKVRAMKKQPTRLP